MNTQIEEEAAGKSVKVKNSKTLIYLAGGCPLEKVVLRTALGRIGLYKVMSYNHTKAIFLRLSDNQPSKFRTKDPQVQHEGQNILDMRGLVELMVPEGY